MPISCFWLFYNTHTTLLAGEILAQDAYYGDSTQLLFLRARYYNPANGRFTARDTFAGYISQPQTQNRFLYTQNNPIRYTDPTGHYSWEDFVAEGKSLINDPVQHTLDQIQKNQGVPWECTDVGQIALWAAPAIAPLVIVAAIPMVLVSPDSAVDLAFMIHDHYTGDYQAFALDAMGLMIPGVTGLGMLSHADDVYRVANTADNFYDTSHLVNASDNALLKNVCSFSEDTKVATIEGEAEISEIEVGDYVLAWNEETGETGYYEVTDTFSHHDPVLTELVIDGEWIETTPEHPFYTLEEGWVPADELKPGMHVREADGDYELVWLKWNVRETQEMYNLSVDEAHTFYVGDGQWLVHNSCKNLLDQTVIDVKGQWLVDNAVYYHKILRPSEPITIAVGQSRGRIIVALNGKAEIETYERLLKITNSNSDVRLVFDAGTSLDKHAERILYEYYQDVQKIGISNAKNGACSSCSNFFMDLQQKGAFIDLFKPATIWK